VTTNLNSKSILVAGGSGGLGQEIVAAISEFECSVMLIHRSENEKSDRLRNRLKGSKCRISFYECDFTNAEEINDAIDIFFEQEKEPYAFINTLGDPARVDWQKGQIQQMQDSFLKNASAPLHSAKQFAIRMRDSNRSGNVVLFSSMQGLYPFEGSLYYGTPKAALIHGAKILAKEFGGNPMIRINVIAPGVNNAGMAEESIRKGKYQKYVDQKIIPQYGDATSVANLALFLLDPDLYMTGQTLLYDGGMTLRRDLLK
jgi:NAD(P)-dependent dehydrogenase (short-subunit alcohol dehydrogenase family)